MGLKKLTINGIHFKPKKVTRLRSYAVTDETRELISYNNSLLQKIFGTNVTQDESLNYCMQLAKKELDKVLTRNSKILSTQMGN